MLLSAVTAKGTYCLCIENNQSQVISIGALGKIEFEKGLELAKACKDKLSEVENKVEDIKKKFGDLDVE